MSSTIYQDSFVNARPGAPYHAVTARLSLTRALTQDLASYYHERALVEDAYVKSLQKLSTRLHQAGSHTVFASIDELGLDSRERQRQLGAWHAVRVRLEVEVNELAKQHETWRRKTVEEVETPLRQSLSKPEWARWQQGEASLGSTVREYESTLDKVQKVRSSHNIIMLTFGSGSGPRLTSSATLLPRGSPASKEGTKSAGSTSTKLLTSQAHLATLGSSLKSATPAFLDTSQKLDESHQLFLKEALIRSGTFTSDLGRDRMEAGEGLLNTVLGVDEQAEIQGWGLREGMKASGGGSAAASGVLSTNEFGATSATSGYGGAIREESIAEEPIQAPPPTLAPPAQTQDRMRASSNARPAPPPVAPLPLPSPAAPKKSGGGFKFSKVFKRDKGSSGAASSKYGTIETNNQYRGSADRQSIESRDSASVVSRPEAATRSSLLAPHAPRLDRTASGSSSLMGGSSSADAMQAPIMPTTSTQNRDSLMPGGTGGLFRRASSAGMGSGSKNGGQAASGSGRDEPLQEPTSSNGATVDEEGYSVPPAGYDKQPWERTAQGSNLMDDDDDDEVADTAAPLQSSSRAPAVALAPAIITEAESDRQAALEKVQSTLLSSGPASSLSRRTTRGRRDINRLSSMPGLSGATSPIIADEIPLAPAVERQQQSRETSLDSSSTSPAAATTVFAPSALNRVGSPTMSSDRAMSMMSTTSRFGGAADPFEHESSPGLRANIVETVNVLSKGGEVTRVMITGEVHLSYRADSSATAASPLRFRIAQFDQFEKAAPNTTYISPVAGGFPGEFEVLPALAAQHGSTVVVLKYQVRIGAGQESRYNPLSVKALWKCEPTQTKLIISYKANVLPSSSSSPFGEDEEEPLRDLEFSAPLAANVSTVQAKPAVAKWHADTHRLIFSLPEPFESGPTTEEKKLLASVGTDAQCWAQPLAVKWAIRGRLLSEVGVEMEGEGFKEVRKAVVAGKYLVAP
ncbi:BZ3501_MvSof-1269-A2-R1_Chr12-2g03521 [Microbotryum saponariae]|nr:BZ3501_MvSof-1269-A2-R1_Chr12-2g03521 [Microbotryum saponariae]